MFHQNTPLRNDARCFPFFLRVVISRLTNRLLCHQEIRCIPCPPPLLLPGPSQKRRQTSRMGPLPPPLLRPSPPRKPPTHRHPLVPQQKRLHSTYRQRLRRSR